MELRKDGRTDGKTDGMTDRCKPVYPPLFQSGGIKKVKLYGRIYIRKLVLNQAMQRVNFNLYTKYQPST